MPNGINRLNEDFVRVEDLYRCLRQRGTSLSAHTKGLPSSIEAEIRRILTEITNLEKEAMEMQVYVEGLLDEDLVESPDKKILIPMSLARSVFEAMNALTEKRGVLN